MAGHRAVQIMGLYYFPTANDIGHRMSSCATTIRSSVGSSTGGMLWRGEARTWHIVCAGLNCLLEGAQMNEIASGEDAGELTELLA